MYLAQSNNLEAHCLKYCGPLLEQGPPLLHGYLSHAKVKPFCKQVQYFPPQVFEIS